MSNWEQFQTAYQTAPPELKNLIDSEKIPTCVQAALTRRQANKLQAAATTQISYEVLGVQTIDETLKNLTQVGIIDALQFLAEVKTAINQPSAFSIASKQLTSPDLASEISAAEQELLTLQNTHTKPPEIVDVRPVSDVVYQSSQADILQKPVPAVNNLVPNTPRWDTDTQK